MEEEGVVEGNYILIMPLQYTHSASVIHIIFKGDEMRYSLISLKSSTGMFSSIDRVHINLVLILACVLIFLTSACESNSSSEASHISNINEELNEYINTKNN